MTTKSKAKAAPGKSNFQMQSGSARAETLKVLLKASGKPVALAGLNLTALGYLMRRSGQKKLPFKIERDAKKKTVTLRKA
jgi:hypothetical protein